MEVSAIVIEWLVTSSQSAAMECRPELRCCSRVSLHSSSALTRRINDDDDNDAVC